MRFSTSFSRWKGGGGTALGSDSVPNGAAGTAGTPPVAAWDHLVSGPTISKVGAPVISVLVGYNFKAAGASTVSLALHVWDALSQRWYRSDAGTLAKDAVARFRVVSPGGLVMKQSTLELPTLGQIQAILLATDAGSAGTGEHVFSMGLDVTEG